MKTINKYIDVAGGLFWFLVAVAGYILSMQIVQRASTDGTVGPAFMPKLICVLIMAVCLVIMVAGLASARKGIGETGCFPEEGRDITTVVLSVIICIVYSASLTTLGFVIASTLFLIVTLSLFDLEWKKHVFRTIAISVLTSVATYVLFRYAFSLMLPAGTIF